MFSLPSHRRWLPALGLALAASVGLGLLRAGDVEAAPKLQALMQGPIGIGPGQTMRLNAFLAPTARAGEARLRLTFIDGVSGQLLNSEEVTLQRGKGVFLDYTDEALSSGERRCVVGIVSPRDAASGQATGVMQVYESSTGRTVLAQPLSR